MKTKSVVLLSGGLDSSVNLFEAHKSGEVVLALFFNYGQKASVAEKNAAKKLTEHLRISLKTIELPWFADFGQSSLIRRDQLIPKGNDVDIQSQERSEKTARSVWVPNRNGIFLNIAAGFAEALRADVVVPGFNWEEAQTFPDNSADFMKAMDKTLSFSTANQIRVHCYTTSLQKPEILRRGLQLGLPLEMIWPCYEAKEKWCGQCESCLRSKRAFKENQIDASTWYLE